MPDTRSQAFIEATVVNNKPNPYVGYLGALGIAALVANDPRGSDEVAAMAGYEPYRIGRPTIINGYEAWSWHHDPTTLPVDISVWQSKFDDPDTGKRDVWVNVRGTENLPQAGWFATTPFPVPDVNVDALVMPWLRNQEVQVQRVYGANLLPDWDEIRNLTFCGHSLGGAFAYYKARQWSLYHPQVNVRCITFGAPKCMGAHSSDTFPHVRFWGLAPIGTRRCDPVPYLPPSDLVRPDLALGTVNALNSITNRIVRRTGIALSPRITNTAIDAGRGLGSAATRTHVLGLTPIHQQQPWFCRITGEITDQTPGNWLLEILAHDDIGGLELLRTGAYYHAMGSMYLPAMKRAYEQAGGRELRQADQIANRWLANLPERYNLMSLASDFRTEFFSQFAADSELTRLNPGFTTRNAALMQHVNEEERVDYLRGYLHTRLENERDNYTRRDAEIQSLWTLAQRYYNELQATTDNFEARGRTIGLLERQINPPNAVLSRQLAATAQARLEAQLAQEAAQAQMLPPPVFSTPAAPQYPNMSAENLYGPFNTPAPAPRLPSTTPSPMPLPPPTVPLTPSRILRTRR